MPIGLQFPFAAATGSVGYFAGTDTIPAAIAQNARALLATNWGERVMQPDFGCNLIEFCFEQLSISALKSRVTDRIQSQFRKWMPFLDILATDVTLHPENPNGFRVSVNIGYGNVAINVAQDVVP